MLDDGGTLRGLLTLVHYPTLSWIGNVVVAPAARGKGHGERLMRAAIDAARARGSATVALYSVPKAVTLYERVGFVRDGSVVALGRAAPEAPAPAADVPRMEEADLPEVARFDRARAGFGRGALLAELHAAYPGSAFVLRRGGAVAGYAFAKPAWSGSELGPVVADEPADARTLVDAALGALGGEPVDLGVPSANAPVLARLAELGFERRFEAPFMHVGPAPPTRWASVAAVGGLEKG